MGEDLCSYTSDKGLITRIVNSQNINNPVKKLANELNKAFSKEEVQIVLKKKT
jgi:hypothetical protein